MSILSIVQDAAVNCGFQSIPATAVSNANQDVQQLVIFAKNAGRELMERANWVNLDTAGTVTGDGVSTLFQLPIDWDRFSPGDKSPRGALVSNKFPLLPLYGPINTEDLNLLKALPASTVRPVWRIIGGALEIWPALSAGEIVTFNYFSQYWIMNAGRTVSRPAWQADDDFSLINEDTIMKGTVWRWKASKGLQYAEEFRAYEMSFARNAGQQQTERVVSASRKYVFGEQTYLGTITDLTTPITG
jgi:hypothetical protein